nr:type III pantothenate kinase [Sulfobacillus harzensis]
MLAIDIGNTHIKIGLWDNGQWIEEWRLATDLKRTPDEYRLFVRGLLLESKVQWVDRAIVASVVPLLTPFFLRVLESVSQSAPVEVVPPGYGLGVDYPPQNLGPDRFVNALGAWRLARQSVVVVDVGTTATVDAVVDGVFVGGAIAPGPHFLAQALAEGTARLPHVTPAIEPWMIGKNTEQAIRAGVGQGFAGMVKSLIENTRQSIGAAAPIILTGGWAARLQPHLGLAVRLEPRLTLEGLRFANDWLTGGEIESGPHR